MRTRISLPTDRYNVRYASNEKETVLRKEPGRVDTLGWARDHSGGRPRGRSRSSGVRYVWMYSVALSCRRDYVAEDVSTDSSGSREPSSSAGG